MNYIHHLNVFFRMVQTDQTLSTAHVSLYMAMFQYWNAFRFKNPFPVSRDTMMQLSKIGSKNTYHKCIKELHHARFIVCHPRVSKFESLKISIPRLDLKWQKIGSIQLDIFEDNLANHHPKNGTQPVPKLIPQSVKIGLDSVPKSGLSYKQVNIKLLKCVQNTPKKNNNKKDFLKTKNAKKSPGCPAPKKEQGTKPEPPGLAEIESFFLENNYPADEAKKFFLYNQSKGWMFSTNLKIADWHPLAHKWMLNEPKPNTTKKTNPIPNQHLNSNKNYGEPL